MIFTKYVTEEIVQQIRNDDKLSSSFNESMVAKLAGRFLVALATQGFFDSLLTFILSTRILEM